MTNQPTFYYARQVEFPTHSHSKDTFLLRRTLNFILLSDISQYARGEQQKQLKTLRKLFTLLSQFLLKK